MNKSHPTALRLLCAILCSVLFLSVPSAAQTRLSNTDLQILMDKIKADKKLVIASNMEPLEAEKMTFWPIYDAYQKDLQALNDRLVKTLRAYADAYIAKTLTNEQAKKQIGRASC